MTTPGTVSPQDVTQFLTFRIAGDTYAVRVLQVQEIIEYTDAITRVPNAPPAVRGVLNLRGRVLPVVDLASRLGLPPIVPTNRTCIVIVELRPADGPALTLGLLADAVEQVIDLAASDIQPAPAFGAPVRSEFLDGLGADGDRFMLLLRLDEVLRTDEISALRQDPALLAAPGNGSGS